MNEADKIVAQVCREAGVTAGRGRNPQVTARTVRGWREEIDAEVGRHSEAARAFDRMKQSRPALAKAVESKGAEAVPHSLLEGLRLSLVQMRAHEH